MLAHSHLLSTGSTHIFIIYHSVGGGIFKLQSPGHGFSWYLGSLSSIHTYY